MQIAYEEAGPPSTRSLRVRFYAFISRISILAALVLGSAVGGGWKWDFLPH